MAQATNTSLGEIRLAGDLAGNNNALAPALTASGVTAGSYILPNITVNAKGLITSAANGNSGDLTPLIPIATTTSKGIASFSSTYFNVSGGNVSINTGGLPVSSSSVFGLVKSGTNIDNTGGTLSIADAAAATKGVASFNSTDFTVSSGAVSLNYAGITPNLTVASSINLGVVKTGSGITNTAGTISIADATTATKGIASFNSSDFSVSSGVVSVATTVGRTDVQNVWQRAQAHTAFALTYGATVTPDFSQSNVFTLTATGNFTLANPTNVVAGTTYLIIITQDATGGRTITWGSNFKFGTGAIQTLSAGANKRDIISVFALSSTQLLVTSQLGF